MYDSYGQSADHELLTTIHRAQVFGLALLDITDLHKPFIDEEPSAHSIKDRRDEVAATKFSIVRN